MCVATQTEDACIPSTSYASISCQTEIAAKENLLQLEPKPIQKQLTILSPKVGKGPYPCLIGSCTVHKPHGRMIGHLRYYHKDSFYEVLLVNFINHETQLQSFSRLIPYQQFSFPSYCIVPYDFQFSNRCNIFKQSWDLDYTSQDYDYAFFIRGMGLFFFHMSIDKKGGLIGSVHMVNSNEAAKQFTYALRVGSGPQGVSYSAAVRVHLYCNCTLLFLSNLYVDADFQTGNVTVLMTLISVT